MNNKFDVLKFDDLLNENVEILDINIDDYDIEIIEVDDEEDVSFDLPVYNKKINKSFLDKIRERLNGRKFAVISFCAVTLIVTLTSVFLLNGKYSKSLLKKQDSVVYSEVLDDVSFSLNGPDYNTVFVNGSYEEKGANIIVDGVDCSNDIIIDSSSVDVSRVGVYHVIYSYVSNMNKVTTLYRTINVVDNEAPSIVLLGSNVYSMYVGDNYDEAGFLVSDNSNEDLHENVIISNNIDVNSPGVYSVNYSVSDSSGNSTSISRTVIVKYNFSNSTNSLVSNSFTSNGLFFRGMINNYNFQYKMMLKNKDNGSEYIFDVSNDGYGYYQFSLDVSSLSNGSYDFYLVNDDLEPLVSNIVDYKRIVRAHVGDKLVTMSYDKNIVCMDVQNFEYLYDVVIDPGHGGSDYGATNGHYYEKSINLEQSLYEKERFEAHGLKVLLLRDSDNYGVVMGNDSWEMIDRKGYAVGYYGAVSRIVYSNHHNSSGNSSSAGWEILVPAWASYDDLSVEHKIADAWSSMYIESINPYYRFYTKDYEKGESNNKINGEVYGFEDYYAVLRIPNKLFGVKNVLYEGAYINNSNDMYWYYDMGNWKALSEVKIKAYVESLGIEYIAP